MENYIDKNMWRMKDRGFLPWNQLWFYFYSPCLMWKKGLTAEMELLLPSISTRFETDAPQSEGVMKTTSHAIYSETSLIYKLVINY